MRSEGINPWLYKRKFRKGNNKGLKILSEGISAGKAGRLAVQIWTEKTELYVLDCVCFSFISFFKEIMQLKWKEQDNLHKIYQIKLQVVLFKNEFYQYNLFKKRNILSLIKYFRLIYISLQLISVKGNIFHFIFIYSFSFFSQKTNI